MSLEQIPFDLASLRAAYAGGLGVRALVAEAARRCAQDRVNAFIHRLDAAELEPYLARLEALDPASLPLYGVPFAIKDNIDLARVPTTAGCPEFAYRPDRHATVVERLVAAGAVPIGKTNLDQFATGLNGTRSPYGACRNAFDPAVISGGSSSGSAVVVARGWAAFSLGTDTAGSGRVPAALQHLIGLKPTCGLLSTRGVVPACRSLDTVSVFAFTAQDALAVLDAAIAVDPDDPFSRPAAPWGVDFSRGPLRFGVPRPQDLEFFGDAGAAELFDRAQAGLRDLGGVPVEVDLRPFLEAAALLYDGPWVAERTHALRDFLGRHREAVFAPVRSIVEGGSRYSATDAFDGMYRLRALKRTTDEAMAGIDCLLTPTFGSACRIDDMQADPIARNARLGRYTNFVNLLDACAVAVPAGFLPAGPFAGLPWGVTLVAPAHRDVPLLALADRLHRQLAEDSPGPSDRLGATVWPLAGTPTLSTAGLRALESGTVRVAVCGAHMAGLPLNGQLTSRGARWVEATTTAPDYRLYALPGGAVARPGLVRVAGGGAAIALEVWELPVSEFGSFVAAIPAPLGIGRLKLADGRELRGFLCEAVAVDEAAEDITAWGGWRGWLASR